jgi:hypothetical protein
LASSFFPAGTLAAFCNDQYTPRPGKSQKKTNQRKQSAQETTLEEWEKENSNKRRKLHVAFHGPRRTWPAASAAAQKMPTTIEQMNKKRILLWFRVPRCPLCFSF